MSLRLAFLTLLAGCWLIPGAVTASENLKVAISGYAGTSDARPGDVRIDRVLVKKEQRRLYLMAEGEPVRSYRISLGDSPVGHKLFEGDERTPEGTYTLDWRNSESRYYKSIHVSYPNIDDREEAGNWGLKPGGAIMIHGLPNGVGDMAFAYQGLDWTDGCIAVTNAAIDEIWELVADGTPIRIMP
jgi:murein L,D-transpeptidase YafK